MEVQQYPPIKDKWLLKPFHMLLEHEIEYEVYITDQFKEGQDWCEIAVTVQKPYEDYDDGIIFEGTMTSGFKLKSRKKDITPEILFDLLVIAAVNFAKEFAELVRGSSLEGTKISKPEFDLYERYLGRVILNSK
jgi:hypothetical protein